MYHWNDGTLHLANGTCHELRKPAVTINAFYFQTDTIYSQKYYKQ